MSKISVLVKELRWIADYEYQRRNSENIIRRAADTIEMLSEKAREPKQEWIPCSERLPEATGFYICTVNRELLDVRTMKFEMLAEDGYRWLLRNGLEVFPSFVLAWMPLPKPWKGADDAVDAV